MLLQYWMMYFLYILGPALLLCGCLLLTLESSDPWWDGEYLTLLYNGLHIVAIALTCHICQVSLCQFIPFSTHMGGFRACLPMKRCRCFAGRVAVGASMLDLRVSL